MRSFIVSCLIFSLALGACTRSAPIDTSFTPPASTPVPVSQDPAVAVPVETYLPPTHLPGQPIPSPTANGAAGVMLMPTFTPMAAINQPAATPGPLSYVVQDGDYPASIASQFGITVEELLAANNMGADSVIYTGTTLMVPVSAQQAAAASNAAVQVSSADYFKIIPDSELIYGPLSSLLDVNAYVQKAGGYLAYYSQDVNGETLNGAQVVVKVAHNYSVNPRLLLALLEYRSQWVTNPNPAPSTTYTPIGYVDEFHQELYRQLTWSADMLNQGFYSWKAGKVQTWNLVDGSQIVPQPGINPGTAGVQHLFSKLDDQTTWAIDTGPNGLFATYTQMFGYPFDWAIEPLLPSGLTQPKMALPFESGKVWYFTGGAHAGWDQGSPWAALDFAPPDGLIGCGSTEAWVTASAPGVILRADNGAVVEDLDSDGLEQTGWTLLYMHVEARDRVQPGAIVKTGDKIGHPSCEGGLSNATHVHLARRYNGLWLSAADPQLPFILDDYVASGSSVEYDGWLTRSGKVVEALDGVDPLNEIQR